MSVFENLNFDSHEGLHFFNDDASGLKAIIAIHNTRRGPAAGGTRFWVYENSQAALDDALRLSQAMSYKNAMADIPFGGGKAVIMKPEGSFDREALFRSYGRAIETLGGVYNTAEDVGVSPEDMKTVRSQTQYVAGLNEGAAASGDPSPVTAKGIFLGMKAAFDHKFKTQSLKGATVTVQGLGHVGSHLCKLLHDDGAQLIVADINTHAVEKAVSLYGARTVKPDDIYSQEADIFAPCALGGAINHTTIDKLRVKIVAGGANNQLASQDMGNALQQRQILYCPDYVINGGGIINVASELSGTYDQDWVAKKVEGLAKTLKHIFEISDKTNQPTHIVADEMALSRLENA